MITRHPQGGSKLSAEEAVGRIILVDREHHWEGYRPVGRITAIQGRNFVVEPFAKTWDETAREWTYDGTFRDDQDLLVDRRKLRILCDTSDEAMEFIRIEKEAFEGFNALLARTKEKIREAVEASSRPAPSP